MEKMIGTPNRGALGHYHGEGLTAVSRLVREYSQRRGVGCKMIAGATGVAENIVSAITAGRMGNRRTQTGRPGRYLGVNAAPGQVIGTPPLFRIARYLRIPDVQLAAAILEDLRNPPEPDPDHKRL